MRRCARNGTQMNRDQNCEDQESIQEDEDDDQVEFPPSLINYNNQNNNSDPDPAMHFRKKSRSIGDLEQLRIPYKRSDIDKKRRMSSKLLNQNSQDQETQSLLRNQQISNNLDHHSYGSLKSPFKKIVSSSPEKSDYFEEQTRSPLLASPHRAVGSKHSRGSSYWRNGLKVNQIGIQLFAEDNNLNDKEKRFESFDYDEHNSLVRQIKIRNRTEKERKYTRYARWFLTFLVAFFTAAIAVAIRLASLSLTQFKFSIVQTHFDNGSLWLGFGIFVTFNVILVGFGSSLTSFVEPVAGGSGIPEIKCSLNGIKIPRVVRAKTLFVKTLGMLGSVAGSLPVGTEGPMIHTGAICGAGISQGKSTTMGLNSKFKIFKEFRNDREKRDFISCGAAAGVACAFGAPIGGVLFTLEEGSSFWNLGLTWRTFFCAMTSVFFYNVIYIAVRTSGDLLGDSDMFVFGDFIGLKSATTSYSLVEVFFFIGVGIIGGIFGALYNHLNKKLTIWRRKYLKRSYQRVLEAVGVCVLISFSSFFLPYLLGTCLPVGDSSKDGLSRFLCPEGSFNDFGTLMFNQADLAVKQLLHSEVDFSYTSLIVFFIIYFCFSCITYGLAIPG
jgi:chloride channel 7